MGTSGVPILRPVESRPLRIRLANDFEIVVAGLAAMLEPYSHRVEVVETEVNGDGSIPVELTLYDTFGQTQADQPQIDEIIADPTSGVVVVYSWNTQPELIERALGKGCRGYLDKSLPVEELVRSLERIAAGEILRPMRTSGDVGPEIMPLGAWPGQREGLSFRESEVIALITQGYTNPEIAARSFVTVNSLKTYIRSAYRKMGVERRSQAVKWGIEHGMLPREEARR